MKNSLIRASVLIALFFIAAYGIFSSPADDSQTWFIDFCLSKAIGALAAFGFCSLYARWSKADKWIAAYDRWCSKGAE